MQQFELDVCGVGTYGCEAILCPIGTFNYGGRRRYTNDACAPCEDVETKYLGRSNCIGDRDRGVDNASTSSSSSEVEGIDVDTNAAAGTANGGAATTPSSELFILELLYDQTGGSDSWKSNNGWKTEASVCSWYGINCDENGSIASIQLGSNGLKGSLPTEIFSLPNLVHLKVYGNDIDVEFTDIGNAQNLQTLGLDDTGLKSLDGIGKVRSLVDLNVGNNKLKGDIPKELSKLVNLQNLDISNNEFSGPLPIWMKNLASLNRFTASHNDLSGSILDFATMSKLTYLDLSFNQFEGSVPSTLLATSSTDDKILVDLSHNGINGVVPAELSRLSRLSIQLQENEISGIDQKLCDTDGLNDFDALSFGCDGILCPAGSWNNLGRQSNEDTPCKPCKDAKFMGATNCADSSSGDSPIVQTRIIIISTAVTLIFALTTTFFFC